MLRRRPLASLCLLALAAALLLVAAQPRLVAAQDRPPERQMRAYIPPDQIVSFRPSTPLSQFIEFVNPIFERVTEKRVIDPQDRTAQIGVSVSGMQFFDALERVLAVNGLTYRETDRFFVIEDAPTGDETAGAGAPGDAASAGGAAAERPATLGTREIRIDAILFDMNLTKVRELGLRWSTFLGQGGQGGQGGGGASGGGAGGGTEAGGRQGAQFSVRTDELFDDIDDFLIAPDRIQLSTLARFFRFVENEGAGETIANPQITVQSGEEGRIQVGSDIPVQTRDFSGNTVTEFFSTGIIVNVTPTLLTEAVSDSAGAEELDFVHMDVQVENSNSSPSQAGPVIARNTATTQVLLLDGEQTIIGGLYSTDESVSRSGIPILKDLPPWFFGLRYVFGSEQTTTTQRELLIVMQARIVDPLTTRAEEPGEGDLIEQYRGQTRETIRRMGEEAYERAKLPSPPDEGDER